jgi:TfoX/Sxy family transcriptional regulator of competence genes
MVFNEDSAQRARKSVARRKGFEEKKMFGGVGFLLNGNICVGVWKEFLILRLGLDAYEEALSDPYAREFDITGRAMKGWVMVEPDGFSDDRDLKDWVQQAIRFVRTLDPK